VFFILVFIYLTPCPNTGDLMPPAAREKKEDKKVRG
jgi:hypothetical protein